MNILFKLLHGRVRGLDRVIRSPDERGRFGRMFQLKPAKFGQSDSENEANLKLLAKSMVADFDKPFDGVDPEESGIPALYTYLGQFIDHDLTFDPGSSLQKQNDPDALVDFRIPAFDLDNVYGRGPDDQPYMYQADGKSLLLGVPISGGNAGARDLPRNNPTAGDPCADPVKNPARALIGDPRNDENSIVSQLQGLFLRFHNRVVAENPSLKFAAVQDLVRYHYQYVVLNDFLPRIVHSDVIAALQTDGAYDRTKLQFYDLSRPGFMPVEFAVAAYRLGHSMIRPGYRLNDKVLLPIFPVPSQGLTDGLTGFRALNPNWGIDWGRFIDIDVRDFNDPPDPDKPPPGHIPKRLQFAYRIDTSAVNPLSNLPLSVASDILSLPERNLLRGWRLGLPTGQDVAKAMGVTPLNDAEILLGKFVDPPTPPEVPEKLTPITEVSSVFAGNCPLWTYILAETRSFIENVKIPVTEDVSVTTPKLGPVGGRIVAETFVGLMFADPCSLLNQDRCWLPKLGAGYRLKDFVNYALGN
jgi:hypothetical protein